MTSSITTIQNSGASAFVDSQYNSTHFPFGAPPASTFNPRDAGTGHQPLLWADGTSGPQSYVTVGQPGIWQWNGGSSQFNASASTVVSGATGSWHWQGFNAIVNKNGQPVGPVGGYGKGRRRFHRYS